MSYRRYYTPRRDSDEQRQPSRSYDPTLQLERERRANDLKLKSRFEHIFDKYARDFTNVGDEIDMKTGEVVVDNGHITFMQHERDVGSSASSQFVAAFAEELEEEVGNEDEEEQDGDDEDEETGDDVGLEGEEQDAYNHNDHHGHGTNYEQDEQDELSMDHSNSQRSSLLRVSGPHTPIPTVMDSDGEEGQEEQEPLRASSYEDIQRQQMERYPNHPAPSRSESTSSSDQQDYPLDASIVPSTELSLALPPISIEKSLGALIPHQDAQGRIDPAAIQDLGMSIANQIADFLMRATGGRLNHQPHISRDPWSVPPLPRDNFAPRTFLENRDAATPRPQRNTSILDSPGATSLWAPGPDPRHGRPTKRRKKHHNLDPDLLLPPGQGELASSRDDSEIPDQHRSYPPPHAFLGPSYQPSRTHKKFRKEEDDLLKRLRDVDGLSWKQMTTYFPQRTPIALQSRYSRALRTASMPVIVKREIVEILDDDDLESEGTPNWKVLPPYQNQTPRKQPETPLLRQALGKGLLRHDGTPVTVTITDDDDTNDDDSETAEPYPVHGTETSPGHTHAQPGYYYPAPGQPAYNYPYNAFPPANSMRYPQMPQADPKPGKPGRAGRPRKADRSEKPVQPAKSEGRKYHNKPETQPRYTGFDTTLGSGSFGILRSDQPLGLKLATPQQHLIGPMSGTNGTFGMLKLNKPKPGKLEKALKKGRPPGKRTTKRTAKSSTPATREAAYDPDDAVDAGEQGLDDNQIMHPDARQSQESSQALPTPPSDGSVRLAETPLSESQFSAPRAKMVTDCEIASLPPTASMSVKKTSLVQTPSQPTLSSPTPGSRGARSPHIGVVRVQPRPVEQDSEDELA